MPPGEEKIFDPSVRNLSNLNLGGEISPAIGDLKNLQPMDFLGNKLTGQIPDEIGNCVSLMLVGFFYGYSLITTLMILNHALSGIAVSMVMKYADNIVKVPLNHLDERIGFCVFQTLHFPNSWH
ncbi:LRR receptor-like serine/threonine-protein kinase ERL1 [Camellia sinensis]|uniref:LRR receptor-like serine/threonine-protein kinase ERL1 n=1 Tax=Camellia sinensis TaxID=4442 RepID=UPI001035B1EE|nr:LRR receptor-like serine/threonine-protein kinase ERL1 [Camellia sinensis]